MTSRLHDEPDGRPKRDRDAFSSALSAIRSQLRRGDYVLGEALIIKDLSAGLKLSPTPIREALARLCGEGLVEERRGAGYFARQLGVTELAELYHAHLALVLTAFHDPLPAPVETPGRAPSAPRRRRSAVQPSYADQVERLFDAIVRQGGNRPLFEFYRPIADRLAPARLAENVVLDDLDDELIQLRTLSEADVATATTRIRSFHRRRLRVVQEIVRVIRSRRDQEYNTNID